MRFHYLKVLFRVVIYLSICAIIPFKDCDYNLLKHVLSLDVQF
jgi:hypothetical protein